MGFVWFVLGLVAGALGAWLVLSRRRREELDAALAGWEARYRAVREEVERLDREHGEVRARLEERIAELERERDALARRVAELEARPTGSGRPQAATGAGDRAPSREGASDAGPPGGMSPPGAELQRIRGIGPVIAAKLVELGYSRLSDLAALGPDDVARIERAIGFPGRIARERWIEQARELLAAGG